MKGRVAALLVCVLFIISFSIYFLFAPKPYKHPDSTASIPIPIAAPPEEWKDYAPPSQEFSVSIPTLPQHAAEASPAQNVDGFVHYDIYFAQSRSGSTFVINVIEYPPTFDVSNSDAVLNGVMQEMLGGNQANQLMNSNRGKFLEFPSTEFVLKNPDVEAHTRAILKGRILYVLTVMDRDAKAAQANFLKFVGSLKFAPSIPAQETPSQQTDLK